MTDLKQVAIDAIDKAADSLWVISQDIWSHPEDSFEEKHAHAAITDFLEKHGFQVERNYKLETAFRSVFGSGDHGPHIAVLCEYDAVMGLGHACGHNLIMEVGLAAGLGLKAAFDANGQPLGKVTILGTPAEESGGGKIDLINAGVFKDVDVAMMAHPCPMNKATFDTLAVERASVFYHGKPAHSTAYPWKGVNALDAAVLCYQSVSCMRQQFKPTWMVQAVIHNGGVTPTIIPELTELEFTARATPVAELVTLKATLDRCFQSAADATGCTVDIKWHGKAYFDMRNNTVISDLYTDNAVALGVDFDKHGPDASGYIPTASTDMGNVSYVVPSIHPMFYIGSDKVNHTREFTAATGEMKAQDYTLTVGKAIATTALDILLQKDTIMPKIQKEFKARVNAEP